MKAVSVLVLCALLAGCAVVDTAVGVVGTVVTTTADVAGSVVSGTVDAVAGPSRDQ